MRDVSVVSNNAVLNFEFCRRRAHINDLVRHFHELVEVERTIIERARETKSIIHEHGLARTVAFVHPADLRDRGMRFINHYQAVLRKKIHDRVRF